MVLPTTWPRRRRQFQATPVGTCTVVRPPRRTNTAALASRMAGAAGGRSHVVPARRDGPGSHPLLTGPSVTPTHGPAHRTVATTTLHLLEPVQFFSQRRAVLTATSTTVVKSGTVCTHGRRAAIGHGRAVVERAMKEARTLPASAGMNIPGWTTARPEPAGRLTAAGNQRRRRRASPALAAARAGNRRPRPSG